jgi:hypothetical protein
VMDGAVAAVGAGLLLALLVLPPPHPAAPTMMMATIAKMY